MNSTQCTHELQKENWRDEQGAWKDGASDWSTADPWCYRYAALIARKSHVVQALRSEHAGPGESELHNKWKDECQLACIERHTCIDKFKEKSLYRKLCRDHRHIGVYSETSRNVSNTNVDNTNYTSLDFGFIGLIRRGDNPSKKPSSIYHIPHITIIWVHTTWVALSVAE